MRKEAMRSYTTTEEELERLRALCVPEEVQVAERRSFDNTISRFLEFLPYGFVIEYVKYFNQFCKEGWLIELVGSPKKTFTEMVDRTRYEFVQGFLSDL